MVAAAALAAVAYAVGVRRLARRGRAWPAVRSWAFAAATATAVVATSGWLPEGTDLRAHMVEHILLGMVAPLLAALAAPVTLVLQAGGPATRRLARTVLHGPVGRALGHPMVGWSLFGGGLVVLYLTPLLDAAANDAVHLAVHAHVVLSGFVFLVPLVGVDRLPRPVPFGGRLLAVLVAVPFHAFLGLALLSADEPVAPDAYPSVDEQREAAGMLWGSGELLTVTVAGVVFAQWWRAESRITTRRGP